MGRIALAADRWREKKHLYAMRNRRFPELDKALSPEQAAQIKAQLTAAADRIVSSHHDRRSHFD